jgi:phosphatidylserine/phosphatidylglycerophosphate/cardiolipin synthase-like enzyme
MSAITAARAYANNHVAFIGWHVEDPIPSCLGFELTRIYSDATEKILAAWAPFKGQANPDFNAQDTSVWPIQKFCWRDLTVRQGRDGTTVHEGEVELRYRIRPLVKQTAGLTPVPVVLEKNYEGDPVPLSYFDEGFTTDPVQVTTHFGEFEATFTNGILSSQGLSKRLDQMAGKKLKPNEQSALLTEHMAEPGDALRERLAGDVLPLLQRLFAKAEEIGGTLRFALYELKDKELVSLLTAHRDRVEVILSTAGGDKANWDTTNVNSRKALMDAGVTVHHRLFNTAARIGHNKFGVLRDAHAKPIAVLTGSTNWTATGMCGQSNNASFITQPMVAAQFQKQWDALLEDTNQLETQGDATTFSAPNKNVQGQVLRTLNGTALPAIKLGKGKAALWFSPNTKGTSKGVATPPDLGFLYSLMRKAHNAILFACFQPSGQGKTSIIAEAIDIGLKDRSLLVFGSVSDRSAMPVSPDSKDRNADGKISQDEQANTFRDKNVQVVLATALGVRDLIEAFARRTEVLTTGKAIIHDKIVVIDPLSETDCVVAFGSHNLGYKASYCNDENMVIVRGHRDLAVAYAVHVIDLWEHYRFRAIQVEMRQQGKKPWDGLLKRDDTWQTPSLKSDRAMLANYFAGMVSPHPHQL